MCDLIARSGAFCYRSVSSPFRSNDRRVVALPGENRPPRVRLAKSHRHVGGRLALVGSGRSGACVVVLRLEATRIA